MTAGHCTIFAVGDTVVWDHPQPPMPTDGPLAPRFVRIAAADETSVPFMGDDRHKQGLDAYLKLPTPKALAVGPGTALEYVYGGNSSHDVVRRALQICGDRARAPCLLVAVDNDAVTRVPQSMRATGLLETDGLVPMPEALRQQLLSVSDTAPWYALATSAGGKFAIGTSKSTEGEAVDAALASCRANGEVGCAIAAIGPYRVRPKMAASP